jgi:hypothetical protein
MGQLANYLRERDKGKFPIQLMANPKAFMTENSSTQVHRQEYVHMIVTLRSGRQVDNQVVEPEVDLARQEGEKGDNKEERDAEPSTITLIIKDSPRSFVPKTPYPERLKAPKKNVQFVKILEVFKQV